MSSNTYTTVVGVDKKHLEELQLTWPTWRHHKPSILQHPMVVFFDRESLCAADVQAVVDHPNLHVEPWPRRESVVYEGGDDKWTNPQRYKMLAGYVHVPALVVDTPYWLKLDTDTVATGNDDWIVSSWFDDEPVIISHPWGFTKPADQMIRLDEWAAKTNFGELRRTSPLNLVPREGWSRISHARIISWCGLFSTSFAQMASQLASMTCGLYKMPVPSQDGYHWYLAKRLGLPIYRTSMKLRGWEHWSSLHNVKAACQRSLGASKCLVG